MSKKIIINQNSLLKLKEMVDNENLVNHKTYCPIIDEAAPEVDEYEIGGEEKNGDVVMGGNYFHVKESSFNKLPMNVTSTILKYRPNKFSRWAVISLANLSLIPKYFEKRTYALEYKKWLSRDRRLLPIAIVDLDGHKNYITEGYRVSVTGDLELINTIEFIPHENAREEGYEDNEIDDFEPYYEIEAFDNNGETILYGDLTVDELFDYFPQSIINDIIDRDESNRVTLSNPSNNTYRIEDILYRDTTPSNIDDVDEVNRIAKKLQTGGPSAYLLVDGEFISFQDHISITNVDGVTPDKFLALGNIRIKNGGIELIKKPTREQLSSIKQWVRSQDEVVIDFAEESNGTYPRHLFSATYKSPNPNRIVNDIIYYFEDGVRPQGNMFEEKNSDAIFENTFEKWFGNSILKDENGQPLKMYHGTDAEFNSFSKDFIGKTGAHEGYGFNFTPFESRARGYNDKNVIAAYLRVTNPMTTKDYNISVRQLMEIIRQIDEGKPYTDTIVAAFEQPRYGEGWDKKYYMRALQVAARTIYQYNKESEYGDAGIYADICVNGNADVMKTIDVFEKIGYDSAIFYDDRDRINTVVVFEPNQVKLVDNKTFSTTSDIMGENIDFEVDSSEIDLSSFKKQDELVPNIWEDNGNTLNSRVRLKLLDIADDFWKFVNLNWVEPKHIVLCGSICNFNWSSYSDIDLHIVVDLNDVDEKTDFVREYLDTKKNEWNEEHEHLKIMGYAVELYAQDVNDETESNGIYDLEENTWIKKPNSSNIKPIGLNKFSIKDKTADLMTIIDGMEDAINSTDDTHVAEEIGKDAEYLWDKIKAMRKDSLDSEGENGSGNISYKYMRRMGYLDKLWDIRYLCYDKTNSLNEGVQYDNFRTNQVLRYKIIGTMVEDGYVFHGASEEFDSFDENKIRGGSRGAYGYGAYFTNAAYKCEEYGDRFMIANINDFSFIDLEDTVNPYNNPFTNGLKEYNWLKGRLDDVRTAREYDEISNKIDVFNSNPNKDLIERAESVISSYDGRLTYRTLNSNIPMGYEDYSKRVSEMYLSLGYDGFICGNQFVIFNFNKLNANMVKDKEALIEEYYNKIFNTVKESKEIVKEYLEKDYNAPLYHYFKWASEASAEDKARDLAYECSHYLYKYIKQVHYRYQEFDELLDENGEFDAYDEEKIEKFIEYLVKERLCDHFISVMGDIVNGSGMYNDLPTWMHTDFLRVVKNEWCIHFGNDAMNIALEGFTGGTEDISHLSYTDAGRQKHQAGYNFAFLIDDRNVDRNEYGNEAVIFRTSGVLVYHYGDNEDQVIFYGPNAHEFIPIRLSEYGEWVVEGKKGQVLKSGDPSEIAAWATENLPQYRKQIITGKNGYIPMKYHWDSNLKKNIREPYPFYRESIKKYSNTIKLLKEEFSVDGNSEHNPYKQRWDAERKALKDFVCNYGKLMQSREDDKCGRLYKCFWDKTLSQLIGYNYCLCVQWDELEMKPRSVVYIRACDRFTPNIRRNIQFDTRGRDNLRATSDDYGTTNNQQTQNF